MLPRHVSWEDSLDGRTRRRCSGATHKIHASFYRHSQCAGEAVQGVQKGQEGSGERA